MMMVLMTVVTKKMSNDSLASTMKLFVVVLLATALLIPYSTKVNAQTQEQRVVVQAITEYVQHAVKQHNAPEGSVIPVMVACKSQKTFEVIRDFSEENQWEAVDAFIADSFKSGQCGVLGPQGSAIKGKKLFGFQGKYAEMNCYELHMYNGFPAYTMIPNFEKDKSGVERMLIDTLEINGVGAGA